jgi:hypothetical protein
MLVAAQQVYAQGGAPAFFRGIGARALSNGINSAVFFAFFEMIRTNIAKVRGGAWRVWCVRACLRGEDGMKEREM